MSETLQDRVERLLWGDSPWARSRARRVARMPARFVYALARDLTEGQLTLRAMSLVYTTLLAVVPLLAFAFSVMKGLGVHRDVEPLLMEFLQPLGAQAEIISSQIIGFVENVRGGLLGSIGLAVLIFTVISMIQKIEDTFNYIWQVQKSRSLARRFSDYLSVLLVGPLLMVTAIGLLATITSSAVIQRLVETRPLAAIIPLLGGIGSFSLVVGVFAFFYAFVPNTRVRLHAALVGAALAAGAWTLGGSVFAAVVVGSTRFAAIYSSFAIAIVGLIWLYLSWLILLLGAQIAFYVQYPGRLMLGRNELKLSIARMEQLALGIMQQVGDGFRRGRQPDFASLAAALECPARSLEQVTGPLEKAGLLLHTEKGKLVPGRDPDTIRLADILVAVRGDEPAGGDAAVAGIVAEMRTARMDRLAGRTLADLATASEHAASLPGDGHPPDEQ
jgi:membrane protein